MGAEVRNHARWTLVAVCAAQCTVLLDATVVTTALPSIRAALGLSGATASAVLTMYDVAFGGLLITGGRAADRFGARRVFTVGLLGFVGGSVVCAAATSPAQLIAGRILQGVAAAAISPATLALLVATTRDAAARRRALGWWTAAGATGAASGWVLGGLAAQYVGWTAVFWCVVPVGALAVLCGRRSPSATAIAAPLGATAGALVTVSIGAGVLVLTDLSSGAALDGGVVSEAGVCLLAAALLAVHERRAAHRLLGRALLRAEGVLGGDLATLLLNVSTTAVMYCAVLIVQQRLALPPARAALLFPVFNVALIVGSTGAARVLGRAGPRAALLTGLAGVGAGAGVAAATGTNGSAVVGLLVAFVLMGCGSGLASVTALQSATAAVRPSDRGTAAGLVTLCAQVGASIGLALAAPLAGRPAADTDATPVLAAAAVVAGGAAAAALLLPRTMRRRSAGA